MRLASCSAQLGVRGVQHVCPGHAVRVVCLLQCPLPRGMPQAPPAVLSRAQGWMAMLRLQNLSGTHCFIKKMYTKKCIHEKNAYLLYKNV